MYYPHHAKWNKEHYDFYQLRLPKDSKREIIKKVNERGISFNQFLIDYLKKEGLL